MPKLAETRQSPTANPAPAANASDGRGPRNVAKTPAAIRARTKLRANTCGGCTGLSASPRPAAWFQAFPNSAGEYHNPPSRNVETAATNTAQRLTPAMTVSFLKVGRRSKVRRNTSWVYRIRWLG